MRMGIIYRAIVPNGKFYIGQTIQKLTIRKSKHLRDAFNLKSKVFNTHFSRAIRKYGNENFKWEIISNNIPEINLNLLEIWNIAKYNSYKCGYNSTKGGEGTSGKKCTEETKQKISEANKGKIMSREAKRKISESLRGKKLSEETRRKISVALNGKKHTEETKRKISKAVKGEKHPMFGKYHSKKTKHNMSAAHKGKKHTEETKQKISMSHKGKKLSEVTKEKLSEAHKGKKHTEETKEKLSKAHKGKKHTEKSKQKMSKAKIGIKRSEESKLKQSISRKEKHYGLKLTVKDVLEIREKYVVGNISYIKLAKKYNVSGSLICYIINNKLWTNI